MYVFEFDMELTRDDLADIWQNLKPGLRPPKFESKEVIIQERELINKIISTEEHGNLYWLVFKVKRRAKKDFEIMIIFNY